MHHVAAGHQHNAFITQRGQFPPHFEMPGRRFGAVDAQLNHRDIRLRIHFNQHAPRAMVKSPGFFVESDRHRREQLHQSLRQRRRARRRIMGVIQRLWETAEVVNGLRGLHRRHARTAREPVRRDHHNRLRTRQGFAQVSPGASINVVFQHVHWAAMAEKQRGHSGRGHDDILRVSM